MTHPNVIVQESSLGLVVRLSPRDDLRFRLLEIDHEEVGPLAELLEEAAVTERKRKEKDKKRK
jgi:hypothetical protein